MRTLSVGTLTYTRTGPATPPPMEQQSPQLEHGLPQNVLQAGETGQPGIHSQTGPSVVEGPLIRADSELWLPHLRLLATELQK